MAKVHPLYRTSYKRNFENQKTKNCPELLYFLVFSVIIHSIRRLFDEDASHLPHGHVPVVGVGVVVPLDGEEVGIVGKVDWRQQALALFTPETGRDGNVSLMNN